MITQAGGEGSAEDRRTLDWRRLRGRVATGALIASFVGATGQALGTVIAGRLAQAPSVALVWWLALCLLGAAMLDTVGRIAWAGVSDRAEGRLRDDLLDAALAQPLAVLSEQAVGEVLDRIDDDTHEVGSLVRRELWNAIRTAFVTLPVWVVAGLTWWPAWLLLPVCGVLVHLLIRRDLARLAEAKVVEEMAWTDHAAAMEEGIAGRDDLRTALGQAFVLRRLSELTALVHRRFFAVVSIESRISRRAGLLLHGLLAGMSVAGVALVADGGLSVARLVTLFLVTTTFVGQIDQLARHLPDLQAGLGALIRLRQMLAVEPEPSGGQPVPEGPLDLRLHDLHFSYPEGTFALTGIELTVPAGQTCALVGRSGSGKSTLAALISRGVEPPAGSVLLGGEDVLSLELGSLRGAVGVVTQRSEILAGTLAENITLFVERPRDVVEAAVAELGLTDWVAGLPEGLETPLGPGGTTLSAGEEQLVAFARLLVRDVSVVILDEATARMDPLTEALVVRASDRLLVGRTGLLIAHRLSTTARADLVAVLDGGRVIQSGPRAVLASEPGPFRALLDSAQEPTDPGPTDPDPDPRRPDPEPTVAAGVGSPRRQGEAPKPSDPGDGLSLTRGMLRALSIHPGWGLVSVVLFLIAALTGAYGALTGFVWGRLVADLADGLRPVGWTGLLVVVILIAPLMFAEAIRRYPHWWIAVMLRARFAVLAGQTRQHHLARTPPGEVVARAMDADRFARYADRWVDISIGSGIVVVTAIAARSVLAGLVLLVVMIATALASVLGRPAAGRSAAASSAARARFGRSLVSALESARTVKLAAATPAVQAQLRRVDGGRVSAAVKEHRVQAALDGIPIVLVQAGVVTAWAVLGRGGWDLATALLVASAVSGFDWFGRVAGAVITEAPGTRAWQRAASRLAGGVDLMALPADVDLVAGLAPVPTPGARDPLQVLELRGFTAVHEDGTLGVSEVDLEVRRGEFVLLLGQIGSGKSSLLGALAGLVSHRGSVCWNGEVVHDPESMLRPGRIAHVAQVPRVFSGTFAENVRLDHSERAVVPALETAGLGRDVADAGGVDSLVGHRGVRLSGGQVQRLALARAIATDAEVLLADDVSSALDAATELEVWAALRQRGSTVLGATSKRAALRQADRVVVLVDGRVADQGPWADLEARWSRLSG